MATQKPLCKVTCHQLTRPGGCLTNDLSNRFSGKENDCPGCALLVKVINAFPVERTRSSYNMSISSRSHRKGASPSALTVSIDVEDHRFTSVVTPLEGVDNPWELSIPIGKSDPDACDVATSIQSSTASRRTLATVSSWLSDCLGSHQHCKGRDPTTNPPLLPARVIDIGDGNAKNVVLKEISTANISGLYMCLSYCWGGADFIQSTTANIHSYTGGGIPFSSLPKLFQDFIHVARLFVRYVWIDLLCIIQDSVQDWRHEAGKMEQIYQNSYLTVAAARAQNPHDTLFGSREATIIDSVKCRYIHHLPTANLPNSNHQPSPLFLRGWAYQERLLSPRVLYFFQNEVMFECREGRRCECGTNNSGNNPVGGSDTLSKIYQAIGTARSTNGKRQPRAMQSNWHKIVMQYTSLQLTKRSDRLPALSGIANWVGQIRTAEQYIAGLWTETLIFDLLWYRNSTGRTPEKENSGRIVPWAAPSWSWASVDWGVNYRVWNSSDKSYPKVVSAECVLAGESKTGPITSGLIKLSCNMVKGRLVRPTDRYRSFAHLQYLRVRDVQSLDPCDLDCLPLDSEDSQEVFIHTDGKEYIYLSGDVYIVRMVGMKSMKSYYYDEGFLLLQLAEPSSMAQVVDNLPLPTDGNVFTRLGVYCGKRLWDFVWPSTRTEIIII